jgi:hypothetical protein
MAVSDSALARIRKYHRSGMFQQSGIHLQSGFQPQPEANGFEMRLSESPCWQGITSDAVVVRKSRILSLKFTNYA